MSKLAVITRILTPSAVISGLLSLAMGAHAELPSEIQHALSRAQLSSNEISLIIMPLYNLDNGDNSNSKEAINTTASQARTNKGVIIATHNRLSFHSRLPATVYPEATALNSKATALTPASPSGLGVSAESVEPADKLIVAPVTLDDGTTIEPVYQQNVANLPSTTASQSSNQAGSQVGVANTHYPMPALTTSIEHLPNVTRTPASTMKLIPTFIALDMLGSDFGWHTRVYYTGFMVNKHLYGDLIIEGSGDPKLTDERLLQMLTRVKQAGIEHIHGNIILDSSIFQQVSKDPGAFDNDPLRPYNASPDGLLVNFSSVKIQSYPKTANLAEMIYTPRLADLALPDSIAIRSGGCTNAHYSIAPVWEKQRLSFASALPSGCGEHSFYIAYPDAKEFATQVVKQLWSQLGNTLSGDVINQEKPLSRHPSSPLPLVSYASLPLSNIIHDINHHSNNVMTEQVTLSLPVYAQPTPTGTGKYGLYHQRPNSNYPASLTTIDQWWRTHLTTPPPHLTNGSGLCRSCSLTAANLAELLGYAYHHPEFATYVESLGIAGISGTITEHKARLPDSQAIGRAWIKTGTLNNVTAMAGYVKGQSEQDYVVVGIINASDAQPFNTIAARKVLDTMLDWTARH